jgi:hypothetical protein
VLIDSDPGRDGALAGGDSSVPNSVPDDPKTPKWSAQRCLEYGQGIVRDENSLANFRKTHGGSYIDDPGLADQKSNRDFEGIYGRSISDYLSVGVSIAGATTTIGGLIAAGTPLAPIVQTLDIAVNGFSAPASLGLGSNDLGGGNVSGAVSNFAGGGANFTSITLTGLQLGGATSNGVLSVSTGLASRIPVYGAALNLGQLAIFSYEQANLAMQRIESAMEIRTHYKMMESMEVGALARLNASHAVFTENCK